MLCLAYTYNDLLPANNDVVDGDEHELHKEPNEAHDKEANASRSRNLLEL